tara:strand:+ start:1148 stop:1636 length:489 start_codon:yes stop_codon:yes gene_type:complete
MKITKSTNNYKVLKSIIENHEYKNKKIPDKNTIVIHLRVGDVIDNTEISVDNFLNESHYKNHYVRNLSYYKKIIKKFDKSVKNIVFVYGYHIDSDHSKSEEYIEKLKQFFESNNFNVSKRKNQNADDDFIYMCNSRYFVQSGGGFSKIIANIVRLKGNILYT